MLYNILYYCQCLHVLGGFSAHHQELKTVHTASGICQACLLLPLFFITVNALHIPGGFSAHHKELKTVHTASGICQACLLLPQAVAARKLMMGGETAGNM